MNAPKLPISIEDIKAARERIKDVLPITPLTASPALSEVSGREVYCKWDNKLKTGSFKERGACNFVSTLSKEERKQGVCAASAGNHALALAHHASRAGVRCKIVMPKQAPVIKVRSTLQYGAEVVFEGDTFDQANDYAAKLAKEEKMVLEREAEE